MNWKAFGAIIFAISLTVGGAVFIVDPTSASTDSGSGGTGGSNTPSEPGSTEITGASGNCGTSTAKWEYDASDNTLSISGSGAVKVYTTSGTGGWDVESVERGTDEDKSPNETPSQIFTKGNIALTISGSVTIDASAFASLSIGSVTFGSGFTSIGASAFKNCKSLTNANLSSITSVGVDSFSGCTALSSVTFNSSSTSTTSTTIGSNAFSGCTALKEIDIRKSTMSADSFSGCTSLAKISVSGSTVYKVDSSLVYTYDGKTMYLCPPGYKGSSGVITNVLDSVETINLGSESVTYIIDLQKLDSKDVAFNKVGTGTTSTGIAYSSLGMESVTAGYSSGKFTLTYMLYDGWDPELGSITVSSSAVPTITTGKMEVSLAAGGSYEVLPMGLADLTASQLRSVTNIGGWTVSNVVFEPSGASTLTDITSYGGNITGYDGAGTAVLGSTLVFHGVLFSVNSISSESGFKGLEDLTVEGNPAIGSNTFANCTSLQSVRMDSVTSIPSGLFRYCTDLHSVSLKACTSIGDYAFEGCDELTSVTLGAKSVSIGNGSFNNTGLEMLRVGEDVSISGNPDLLIVHCDNTAVSMDITGDNLIITGTGFVSASYSDSKGGQSQSSNFYRGGLTAVYLGDASEVYVTLNPGNPSAQCLVVLDSQIGVETQNLVVDSGSKLSSLPQLSKDGYRFLGWTSNGSSVTADTTVSTSMVLTAEWQKENSSDNTSTIVVAMFAVAIIATVAILFVNSRR